MVRKLEREQISETAGLTEEQEVELRAIVLNLDDKLKINEDDIFADAEIDALLDKENGVDPDKKDEINETESKLNELLK